ncbi:MAG TPA: hypothetical protein VK168_14220 [Saprospiraceae bacterium]|nr:hypothetical protein [Saprospiraceae bacterium]
MFKAFAFSLLFVLLGLNRASAAMPDTVSISSSTKAMAIRYKSGWIKQLMPVSVFRHTHEPDSLSQEKPSKLARTAVVILVASYVSIAALGNFFLPLAYVGLAGVLVANILAIIVLGRKPNKKSRRYARGVLIITGIMIAGILLLLGALNLLFPGIH